MKRKDDEMSFILFCCSKVEWKGGKREGEDDGSSSFAIRSLLESNWSLGKGMSAKKGGRKKTKQFENSI